MHKISETFKDNIISGFMKCGIFPLDRHKILDRLPEEDDAADEERVNESIVEILKDMRYSADSTPRQTKKRGR